MYRSSSGIRENFRRVETGEEAMGGPEAEGGTASRGAGDQAGGGPEPRGVACKGSGPSEDPRIALGFPRASERILALRAESLPSV